MATNSKILPIIITEVVQIDMQNKKYIFLNQVSVPQILLKIYEIISKTLVT